MTEKKKTENTKCSTEPWITTKSACQHLGVSRATIRRWIAAGILSPRRTPTGEFRFRRSELDQLLN